MGVPTFCYDGRGVVTMSLTGRYSRLIFLLDNPVTAKNALATGYAVVGI